MSSPLDTVERLDAQMLLDPLEEKLDLPTLLVNLRHGQRGQCEIIGEILQPLAGDGIGVNHAPKRVRIGRSRAVRGQDHGLIGAHASAFVYRIRIAPLKQDVFFGTGYKERQLARKRMKTLEIDVAAIHHIEGASLDT